MVSLALGALKTQDRQAKRAFVKRKKKKRTTGELVSLHSNSVNTVELTFHAVSPAFASLTSIILQQNGCWQPLASRLPQEKYCYG